MSVDNFPDQHAYRILEERYPGAGSDQPRDPKAYIVSVPPSMASEMKRKINEGGDADLDEDCAQATLLGIEQMLYLHFKGEGQVSIPDPWSVPRASRSIAPSHADTTGPSPAPTQNPLTADEEYWDKESREELRRSSASSKPQTGAKSKRSKQDAELAAAFEKINSEMRTGRKKRRNGKPPRTSDDRTSEAGPSTQTCNE